MTRDNCIVVAAYGFFTAVFAGSFFHKFSAFFMVGFLLAYIFKMVLSMPQGHAHTHDHGLTPASVRIPNAVSEVIKEVNHGSSRYDQDGGARP